MSLVTIDRRNGLAYVTIDNPPVNSLGQSVRKDLLLACTSLAAEKEITAVVVSGKGRNFVAGADIGELGQTPSEPFLPDVLAAIENAPMPWVAAISGVALGGGLELAMACHGRVADRGARLGLPEVNLGVIPGAGGTVRLPRLVPMSDAVLMITSGKPIGADHALDIGLLDRIAQTDLICCATALAQELAQKGPPVPTIMRLCNSSDKIDWEGIERQLKQKSRGAIAPLEALSSLHMAAKEPASKALSAERARFLRLTTSEQAAALRYVFFAERAAGKSLRSHDTPPVDLRQVGVVGGGTMGAGIATALVLAGSQVRLVERDAPAAEAGRARVAHTIADSVKRGVLTQVAADAALARLSTSGDYTVLADCALVIEAVFEDMAVKRQVFARLDAVMPPEAVLATNTSYLDVDALAETTQDPARILGLHFFSPAHVMKLLELVRGRATGARALATGAALARLLGKVPVVAGVCDGFIGNRIMAAYRRDCEFMLEEGALPQQIDAAMQDYGFAMGIFAVQDLSGLDIAWAQRKAQAPSRDPSARYARIADQLCEAGRLGRKTGQGWYDYASGVAKADPAVAAIIQAEQARAGHKLRSFSAEDIMARILGKMQAEGAALLQEGIAESAADIDVVMVTGYGFPRHKGGPMYLAAKSSSEGKDA